mgnify:FL=1
MLDSVLLSTKQMLGISPEDTSFDVNVIMNINTALSILMDLGLTEVEDQLVIDDKMTWDDLLGGRTDIEYVKTYVYQKVKLIFDPPTSTAAIDAMQRSINELEWRICNNGRN